MTKRCVVGFDGSAPGWAALRWALGRGGPLAVVHVIEADGLSNDDRRHVDERGMELLEEARLDIAARHPESNVDFVLVEGSGEGSVAWSLAAFAEPDDTLVIGTHKTGFLHGRVLGCRSVELAMLAHCDLMVVPMIDLRFRSGVVAGVADEPGLSHVVETAARVAAEASEELLLLHNAAHEDAAGVRSLLADATRIARACAPDLIIRSRFSTRPVPEMLLDGSRGRALLVLGSGRANRSHSPIGSILHDVLLNITAPTLVVSRPAAD